MRTFFYDGNNFPYQNDGKISILLDSAPRSGNQFLNEIVYAAFPTTHQQWGADCRPHNPKSFELFKEFDLVAAIVRDPIDSIASSILAYETQNEKEIKEQIDLTLSILTAINKNKDNISVFTFDDVVNSLDSVVNSISEKLGIEAQPFNLEQVMYLLSKVRNGKTYALPTNNKEKLTKAKNLLTQPKYLEYMNKCVAAYDEARG